MQISALQGLSIKVAYELVSGSEPTATFRSLPKPQAPRKRGPPYPSAVLQSLGECTKLKMQQQEPSCKLGEVQAMQRLRIRSVSSKSLKVTAGECVPRPCVPGLTVPAANHVAGHHAPAMQQHDGCI